MIYDFSKILDLNTIQCCLITAFLYISPLSKRTNFKLRLTIGTLIYLLCIPLLRMYSLWSQALLSSDKAQSFGGFLLLINLHVLGKLFLMLLLLSALFYFCCNIRPFSALYGASLSYISQNLAYMIFSCILPSACHRHTEAAFQNTFFVELLIMLFLYGFCYFFLAKKLPTNGDYCFSFSYSLPFMLLIITIENIISDYLRFQYGLQSTVYPYSRIYTLLLYLTLLFLQMMIQRESYFRTTAELETQLLQQQQRQYQLFHENIENINHKCHDLKYMVAALHAEENTPQREQLLKELEKSIMIYDSYMNTGNKSLDTILANAWLSCENKQIQWTCLADGTAIDFIDPFDLYILLGNALDNAMESLSEIENPDYRFLSVNIRKKDRLAFIRIENYCEKEVKFKNGIPVTTKKKKEEHGFGRQSILSIVERYNGECRFSLQDHIFSLDILLPIPA